MCKFFSLNSDGKGKIMYFDWESRKRIIKDELDYEPDSHTSIADYFEYKGKKEDKLNKYEYDPLTKKFTVDQLNTKDDSKQIENFCKELDFKTIIEPLIIKPIINPLKGEPKKVTEREIELLKQWYSVRDSVGASVRDSVLYLVRASVGASVRDSVGDSVWVSVLYLVRASVGDSVWASVGDSVWVSVGHSVWVSVGDSVWVSVWDSIRDSVGAYTSSFFDIKYKHDFSSGIKLWESGFVPSFDGKTWRLHSGEKAEIVYEWETTER